MPDIESLLKENRSFKPSPEFARAAQTEHEADETRPGAGRAD